MNVAELKELLENMDDGDEVRIAMQPHYPLALHIAGVAAPESMEDRSCQYDDGQCGGLVHLVNDEWHHLSADLDSDHEPVVDDDEGEGLPAGIVWLVAGDQPDMPYAPRAAWESLDRGW